MPPPVVRPRWARRVPGWSLAAFFVVLIVFTYLAVESWNRGDLEATTYLTLVASAGPLVVIALAYYLWPTWAYSIPLTEAEVATAIEAASVGKEVEAVSARERPFVRCSAVVRVRDPACTIGWFLLPSVPGVRVPATSVVFLQPETRDRRALAAFRESLARALSQAVQATA